MEAFPALELQDAMREQIPLTGAMGVEVNRYHRNILTLSAPLEKNLNHKKTGFGGSIYSVAVLSGWGLLWLKIRERGLKGNVVITKSKINFDAPVTGRLYATCRVEQKELDRFFLKLERMGKARIRLRSEILSEGESAGRFEGVYAVV